MQRNIAQTWKVLFALQAVLAAPVLSSNQGELPCLFVIAEQGRVDFGAFSPDGRFLFTSTVIDSPRGTYVRDATTGAILFDIGQRREEPPRFAYFTPNSQFLLTIAPRSVARGYLGEFELWDLETHTQVGRVSVPATEYPDDGIVSSDGATIVLGIDDGIRVYRRNTLGFFEEDLSSFALGANETVVTMAMNKAGDLIAVSTVENTGTDIIGGEEGTRTSIRSFGASRVTVIDVRTGKQVSQKANGIVSRVTKLRFTSSGEEEILVGCSFHDGRSWAWAWHARDKTDRLFRQVRVNPGATLSADGRYLTGRGIIDTGEKTDDEDPLASFCLTRNATPNIEVYDMLTGRTVALAEIPKEIGSYLSPSYFRQGERQFARFLTSLGANETFIVWNLDTDSPAGFVTARSNYEHHPTSIDGRRVLLHPKRGQSAIYGLDSLR